MEVIRLRDLSPSKPLLILDMANNHNGFLEHGKRIVDELAGINGIHDFRVAIKFQYRDLPNFIHKDFRNRRDLKYVDRFLSTRLSWQDFQQLREYVEEAGMLSACTPFDEFSVEKIKEHGFDILKIASASFTDWSLLDKVTEWNGPIVASSAGASIEDLDRVTTLFRNREKNFALMHCVAAYPTEDKDLLISRIRALRERYSDVPIGYSTHEDPTNFIAGPLALASGAVILERHVGSPLDGTELNRYSSDRKNIEDWLASLRSTISMLGPINPWMITNERELESLMGLRRFLFAKRDIRRGEQFTSSDLYLAIPGEPGQLQSKDAGKYDQLSATKDILADQPITSSNTKRRQREERVFAIRDRIVNMVQRSGVAIPNNSVLEISHHFGLDRFEEFGTCMITVVNRNYCKKLLFLLPGQVHPAMYHKIKDETFFLLYGDVELKLDHKVVDFNEGDTVAITPGVIHEFSSVNGAIIEEVSSSHMKDDSFYLDEEISANHHRKTFVHYWL